MHGFSDGAQAAMDSLKGARWHDAPLVKQRSQ
jgi:hypothetical protein